MNKRLLIGLASAGIVGGATFGAAASIGNVDSSNLGAGGDAVASCDSDGVDVTYDVAYDPAGYEVTNVNIGDIDAGCVGQDLSVTLSDDANAALTTLSSNDLGATGSVVVPVGTSVLAEAVEGVDVVINGDEVVVTP